MEFIVIGEKINGSIPQVAEAIAKKDVEHIKHRVKIQEPGSNFIDCCSSVTPDIEVDTMKWMINLIQETTDLPIAVDSPDPHVIAQVYKECKKPGLLNSANGEGDKLDVLFKEAAGTDWGVICLLSDGNGIPKDADGRLKVFDKIMKKAEEYKIKPSQLYIDPLVEMLCTSDDGMMINYNVIKEIRSQFSDIHIEAAISNISFNLPYRKIVNMGYVVLAMNAGLDSAIMDPTARDLMGIIHATEGLLGIDEGCMEYIAGYRDDLFGPPLAERKK